ncbi:hypothetical protein ACJQWK_11405 [Exserohilum turcicum]|uniref:Uncharacterized protein n=1 Tax=Exserohilum turcicum (strain 28A) TaxID=671987 RepID=R0KSP5_EXST2|nr:uncharacterized protein SETTUDRAFT_24946 [Exserohilum turcica Et28A]EOA90822.1 hypothetical protein SETTUDRAFT_24946 [Exserohilum turcica Et28A]
MITPESCVATYVAASQLPEVEQLVGQPPLHPGQGYRLRKCHDYGLPLPEHYRLLTTYFPEVAVPVGLCIFHPQSRPKFPPDGSWQAVMSTDGLKEFVDANPDLPIVVKGTEQPHYLIAELLRDPSSKEAKYGLTAEGYPIIQLYTIGFNEYPYAFDPATHVINGVQYTGAELLSWELATFIYRYCKTPENEPVVTYERIYKNIYERLRRRANNRVRPD